MKSEDIVILYKYLDYQGGLKMLQNSNLQFTNASKFNDPFDCHPALFDYSNAPLVKHNPHYTDFLKKKGECDMENLRNSTWICCLSKVYDSLLMWAYYNNHKGICIGLNLGSIIECCHHKFIGLIPPYVAEVKYKDILQKPNYFNDCKAWDELLTTKAKEWKHEQEVRLITKDPAWVHAGRDIPDEFKKEEVVDWKEIRHYVPLSSDCFESVFLGVNMLPRNRAKIIDIANKLNPNIKIYQMTLDPEAFRLKGEPINK